MSAGEEYKNYTNSISSNIGVSSKKESLFPKWEMSLYPAGLTKAIATVEKRYFIRNELHRLDAIKTDDALDPGSVGKSKLRQRGPILGLERLPISELQEVKDNNFDKKLPKLTLLDEKLVQEENGPTVKDCLQSIVSYLQSLSWLSSYEQTQIANTFLVNFSRHYDNIHTLTVSYLTAKQNRKLSYMIVEHIKSVTFDIMARLSKKKNKMQSAALFSIESNSDRLISTFRTMLNRRLNNAEILEIAMSKIDMGNNQQPHIAVKKENNVIKDLNDEIDSVTHSVPKHFLDPALISKIKKNGLGKNMLESSLDYKDELNKIMTMQFTNRGIIPIVDKKQMEHTKAISDDLIRLIKDTNETDQSLTGNIWMDDRILDEFHAEARDILQYDLTSDLKQLEKKNTEDPILRAHSHISNNAINRRISDISLPSTRIPDRYLGRKDLIMFDFKKLLDDKNWKEYEDQMPVTKKSDFLHEIENFRSYKSRNSEATPKVEILKGEEDLMENTAEDFNGIEAKISNVDFLDENLSRFKEVEELYSEILRSVTQNREETEEDVDMIFACAVAPVDQEIDAFNDPNSTLCLRKRFKKTPPAVQKPGKTSGLKDADGIPISGAKFQIFLSPTKQKVNVDLFRRNRKWAMKKIMSSKYHFKYNYGGYIPPRTKRNGVMEDYITSDDYDDFLASSYCDFVPLLVYQEKRKAEQAKIKEKEEEERLIALQESKVLEKLKEEEKQRLFELFKPQDNLWNSKVLDYMDDIRDPAASLILLPANRPGLEPVQARFLQKSLENLWDLLKMPYNQRLDMGIKYGDHKHASIERSILTWEKATKLILKREAILAEIETFEYAASNPNRFFLKGNGGSSRQRLEEARKRQKFLKLLSDLNGRIECWLKLINDEFNDTVTYQGENYSSKMKRDYLDIIRKVTKF